MLPWNRLFEITFSMGAQVAWASEIYFFRLSRHNSTPASASLHFGENKKWLGAVAATRHLLGRSAIASG